MFNFIENGKNCLSTGGNRVQSVVHRRQVGLYAYRVYQGPCDDSATPSPLILQLRAVRLASYSLHIIQHSVLLRRSFNDKVEKMENLAAYVPRFFHMIEKKPTDSPRSFPGSGFERETRGCSDNSRSLKEFEWMSVTMHWREKPRDFEGYVPGYR